MSAAPPLSPGRREILVVAGEASGDRHAAGLMSEALALDPSLAFAGIGGPRLRAAGMEILYDAAEISVVGIAEVLERLPAIRRAFRTIRERLESRPPAALLLVDFPDFNLALAKHAARLGVPVVYFISPQLWAWRARRVHQIKKRVRRMLVFFPFEESFYREHDVPVTFVGHPLADCTGRGRPVADARRRLGLPPAGPVFGLLPGSRPGEIARHLEPMLATARAVLAEEPRAAFLIPIAETVDSGPVFEATSRTGLPVVALRGAFDPIVEACDAAVVASGTATLEVAVRGVPPVVVYRTSRTTYMLGRIALRVPYISLVNLLADRALVPELVQDAFTPEAAAREMLRLGRPGPDRDSVLAGLEEVRRKLGAPGAYKRAARALLEVLAETSGGETR